MRHHVQFFPPPQPPPPPGPPRSSPPAPTSGPPPSGPPTPTPTVFPPPGTPVPGWIELTFAGGELAPGASTGPIQLRHHRPNWTMIDERDDVSWQRATGGWADNSRITLDVDGVREYGDPYA